MINWSTDEKKFKEENPQEYKIWEITQLINYGLGGEKLSSIEVKKSWNEIKNKIDTPTKQYLQFLLWGKLPSSIRINKHS
jgi:hypothetical protein